MTQKPTTHGGEIDLTRQILMVWKHKYWIVGGTLIFTLFGLLYAFTAASVFESTAIISLKDTQKASTASSVLSQLGGFGGMIAAQLGGANTNLDKLEIILKGEDLAVDVIKVNNLLPKLFRDQYDFAKGGWKTKDSTKIPDIRFGADYLRKDVLAVSVERIKNMLTLRVRIYDPDLAKQFVDFYLTALNRNLQNDAKTESAANREFLETQINNTSDPVIREKILTMIAMEIEKEMLVGSQSIEILRRPTVPMFRESPKRKNVVVLAFAAGLCLSLIVVYAIPFLRTLGKHEA